MTHRSVQNLLYVHSLSQQIYITVLFVFLVFHRYHIVLIGNLLTNIMNHSMFSVQVSYLGISGEFMEKHAIIRIDLKLKKV